MTTKEIKEAPREGGRTMANYIQPRVCRYCRKEKPEWLKKYAPRHYAHFRCWLWHNAPVHGNLMQFLSKLPVWEIRNIPVLAVCDWLEEFDDGRASGLGLIQNALRIAMRREAALDVRALRIAMRREAIAKTTGKK